MCARFIWLWWGGHGNRVLATRTVSERYVKRGRAYVVCEVSFTDSVSGRLMARQRHHQSFMEDQSAKAVNVWRDGTSAASTGKVLFLFLSFCEFCYVRTGTLYVKKKNKSIPTARVCWFVFFLPESSHIGP